MLEVYYYYASVIFVTSVISIVVTLIETRNNYIKLRQMSYYETTVSVFRGYQKGELKKQNGENQFTEEINNLKQEVSSLNLVPGDIIEIPENKSMPCDLILLNGSAVMNESMLTGESIPVLKNSLPFNNNAYNPNEEGKQSTLFAGTNCIETRYAHQRPPTCHYSLLARLHWRPLSLCKMRAAPLIHRRSAPSHPSLCPLVWFGFSLRER